MKIVIVGGSGFIGSKLSQELVRQGHSVISVDLNPPQVSGIAFLKCSAEESVPQSGMISNPDVFINLAGRSIVGPWNKEHKNSIYTSRIKSTQNIVELFKNKQFRPKVFVQASASGVYGNSDEETLSEGSPTKQNTFLAKVARDWEKEGSRALKHGVRTIIIRQGNVLGTLGLLASLRPIYEKGLGGPIGSGNNWFPWIHVDDLVSLYIHAIENTSFQGVLNAVAPEVVRYKEFSKTLARVLRKPHFLRVPKLFFRLRYRGFTDEITSSQKILSLRAWEFGDCFRFKKLESALNAILLS